MILHTEMMMTFYTMTFQSTNNLFLCTFLYHYMITGKMPFTVNIQVDTSFCLLSMKMHPGDNV